jgi:hypothetical protein
MRKQLLFLTITAFILFQGSSPWEGAASVAPAGELPSTGFFVATNSFPRNTVVDITNIETGKSTRAIVAKTLNSPGLLAIVSNEAAQLIGMRTGSVSRIRMVQPTDPIAYLRFTENVNSGAPSFDSGDVVTEETLVADVYIDDAYRPEIVEAPEPVPPPQNSFSSGITGPGYLMEPEWGGTERLNIVDLPGYEIEPSPPVRLAEEKIPEEITTTVTPAISEKEEPLYSAEQKEIIKDISPRFEERAPLPIVKDVPEFLAESETNDVEKETNIFVAEEPKKEVIKETFEYITEQPRDEIIKEIFDKEEYVAEAEETPKAEEYYHYNLVPTEEKQPVKTVYGIDPSDIIPGIALATPERQQETRPSVQPPLASSDPGFSVRTISSLDRGQYYVQIAALPAETVENAVRQIDQRFNPVILIDRDNWYRIVIGPLNQGESAAVLSRFKSIGYKDAFVRRGN